MADSAKFLTKFNRILAGKLSFIYKFHITQRNGVQDTSLYLHIL